MRRIIVEEPVSSAAAWSRRIAVFALAVAAIAVAMGRLLRAEPPATLAVFASALALGVVAALLAMAGLSVVWRLGRKGAREAIVALLCVVALFAWPMRLAVEALRLPPISDVTTDLVEPPAFSRSARAQAARAGRTRDLPDEATRAAQRSAYADLEPVILDLEPEQAFRQTLRAAQAMPVHPPTPRVPATAWTRTRTARAAVPTRNAAATIQAPMPAALVLRGLRREATPIAEQVPRRIRPMPGRGPIPARTP